MHVTFDIPDELASQLLGQYKNLSRAALETLAVEGYRTQRLSEGEVREMLGFSTRMEVHALLADRAVCLHYTPEDLEVDGETSQFLRSPQLAENIQPSR